MLAALTDTPQTLAQLEEATGLPAGKLLGALTELELLGQAQSHQGKRYSRAPPLWLEGRRPLPGAAGPPQGAGLST